MGEITMNTSSPAFYEAFWADRAYQFRYALWSASHDRWPAIRKVWGDLPMPTRVLDFGSGNGVLTDWLAAHHFGTNVLGVDVSETGVAAARETFHREGIRFEVLDPSSGIKPFGAMDVIVSSHVLEHVPDPAAVLAEMLPQADWFVLEVPLEDCLVQSVLASLHRRPRTDNQLGHLHFWNRASFLALLDRCGYAVVREHTYASAPFCPFISRRSRLLRKVMLAGGLQVYASVMATHFCVLARRNPYARLGS